MSKQILPILILLVVLSPVIITILIPSNKIRILKIEVPKLVNLHYEEEIPDLTNFVRTEVRRNQEEEESKILSSNK